MTVSTKKPERKWLGWSVQAGVEQTKIRINPAADTGNRAQRVCQMPEQRHSVPKRLDRREGQRQHGREGVLLGEYRLRLEPRYRVKFFGGHCHD